MLDVTDKLKISLSEISRLSPSFKSVILCVLHIAELCEMCYNYSTVPTLQTVKANPPGSCITCRGDFVLNINVILPELHDRISDFAMCEISSFFILSM